MRLLSGPEALAAQVALLDCEGPPDLTPSSPQRQAAAVVAAALILRARRLALTVVPVAVVAQLIRLVPLAVRAQAAKEIMAVPVHV